MTCKSVAMSLPAPEQRTSHVAKSKLYGATLLRAHWPTGSSEPQIWLVVAKQWGAVERENKTAWSYTDSSTSPFLVLIQTHLGAAAYLSATAPPKLQRGSSGRTEITTDLKKPSSAHQSSPKLHGISELPDKADTVGDFQVRNTCSATKLFNKRTN